MAAYERALENVSTVSFGSSTACHFRVTEEIPRVRFPKTRKF